VIAGDPYEFAHFTHFLPFVCSEFSLNYLLICMYFMFKRVSILLILDVFLLKIGANIHNLDVEKGHEYDTYFVCILFLLKVYYYII